MAKRKPRKSAYIPPSHEVINRKEREPAPAVRTRSKAPARAGATGRGGRPGFEMTPPTWGRTLRRVPIYLLLIFALQYFLAPKAVVEKGFEVRVTQAALSALVVTFAFLPMMFLMERWQYTRWLRRTGRTAPPKAARGTTADEPGRSSGDDGDEA